MTSLDAGCAQADFQIEVEVGRVNTNKQIRFFLQQALRQLTANAADLAIVTQHFDIAAHREFFGRPPGFESGRLHECAADAHEACSRKAPLQRIDQMGREQIAGGFPCDQCDAQIFPASPGLKPAHTKSFSRHGRGNPCPPTVFSE